MAKFVAARSIPTGSTVTHYVNLEVCDNLRAAQDPATAAATSKWFAVATTPLGGDSWFLSGSGYNDEATCKAAIVTLVSAV